MAEIDESLLPPELRSKRQETPKVGKAIAGEARIRKPTLREKFIDTFKGTIDGGSIKEFIIFEMLIPRVVDAFRDVVVGTTDLICYGKTRSGSVKSKGNQYWKPYDSATRFSFDEPRPSATTARGGFRGRSDRIEEVEVDTYQDAQAVLDELLECLDKYHSVSVSSYYDAFGISPDRFPWTNGKWGWTTLTDARIVRTVSGGYTIYLPKPQPL